MGRWGLIAAGKGVGLDADAAGAIVYMGERAIRFWDFVSQGGFTRLSFTDDQHFGFVEAILALSGELIIVVENGCIALANDFDRRFFDGVAVEINAVESQCIIYLYRQSTCC